MLSSKLFAPFADASAGFLAMDARLALGSRVSGNETPGQLLLTGTLDKQLNLQNALAGTQDSVQTAWSEQATAMAKKQQEQQSYLFGLGVIFA